jgi:serine kinase of HPr protein (carbohydrate metabolism regulator)
MNTNDLLRNQEFTLIAGDGGAENEITSMYASDLLSWVISHGDEGMIYLTILTNHNVLAVSYLLDFSAVMICEGAKPSPELIAKSNEKNIPIISTELSITETVLLLNKLGIS